MSKGRRIRMERLMGLRQPNGRRWDNIKPGMMMVIPNWARVKAGHTPTMIPMSEKARFYTTTPGKEFAAIRTAMTKQG